jgi:hypothetical protein
VGVGSLVLSGLALVTNMVSPLMVVEIGEKQLQSKATHKQKEFHKPYVRLYVALWQNQGPLLFLPLW